MTRPPSVDRLARDLAHTGLPHPLLVEISREAIATQSVGDVEEMAARRKRQLLHPVINATGTLLHTNLGRAPWASPAEAVYSNLEFNLEDGARGSRQSHVGNLFATLCDAEAAMVVNNCAAAVTLVTAALAQGRAVAVSRGELVEIGGGFRVPEVVEQSGARLHGVGTTNRTSSTDFKDAVAKPEADIAMLLKVHRSNYKIIGFTESAEISQIADLGIPLVCDIGSGLLDQRCPWLADGPPPWLTGEPAAKQTLASGADLVCFSGDKLLGGPQAGLIVGRQDLISECARHPLARAFRPGSLVLTSLQHLALAYLDRDGDAIPFWRMACADIDGLNMRAASLAMLTGSHGEVIDTAAVPGGGTLPTVEIASVGLALDGDFTAELRNPRSQHAPAIVARVAQGRTILDMRTIDPADDPRVAEALSDLF